MKLRRWGRDGRGEPIETLQFRVMREFAVFGRITSLWLNAMGEQDWRFQRSAGQRVRDCRKFGLDVQCREDPDDTAGVRWEVNAAGQRLAQGLVAAAAAPRRSPKAGPTGQEVTDGA